MSPASPLSSPRRDGPNDRFPNRRVNRPHPSGPGVVVFDWIFAFVHLLGLVAALIYAVVSFSRGETSRGALLLGFLAVYYILVLHKAVLKEIQRKKRS